MEELNLEYLKKKYFELDKPVPYKNFKIYPVLADEYYTFHGCIGAFTLEKNKDPKGISMSELDYFLYSNDFKPKENYFYRFSELVRICLHIENGMCCLNCDYEIQTEELMDKVMQIKTDKPNTYAEECEKQLSCCPKCGQRLENTVRYWYDDKNKAYIGIKNIVLDKDDFKNLKLIVCSQNVPDYSTEYIDPDLEEDRKEAERLRSKNIEVPSLEQQMCCIVSGSSYKLEELQQMSIRKFSILLKTIDEKLHYEIYKMNENSGAVTFKKGLDHWIYKKKKSLLDDVISLDKFNEKMKHVAK